MPLRVKLTDRFQKRLSEWARKRKPFKKQTGVGREIWPSIEDLAIFQNSATCRKLAI